LKKEQIRINAQIRVSELRVLTDTGENLGVMSSDEALKIARERGLDLIEISPRAKPPIVKIADYALIGDYHQIVPELIKGFHARAPQFKARGSNP